MVFPPFAGCVTISQGSLKFHYDAPAFSEPEGDDVNPSVGAFASVVFDRSSMVVTHLSDGGVALFTAPAMEPRKV